MVRYTQTDKGPAPNGWRKATVMFNQRTFGAWMQNKTVYFYYKSPLTFCIEPPPLQEWYSVLYDAIWKYRDTPADVPLMNSELEMAKLLPCGLNGETMCEWSERANELCTAIPLLRKMRRATWLCPLYIQDDDSFALGETVHPHLDRVLTMQEFNAVHGSIGKYLPELLRDFVPAAEAWIKWLAHLCECGHWGVQDWQSRFEPGRGWVGENCTSGDKLFDLRLYYGRTFDKSCYEEYNDKLHYRGFNLVPGTNRLARSWSEIDAERRNILARRLGGEIAT